jgi:hypothetical protein
LALVVQCVSRTPERLDNCAAANREMPRNWR